MEPLCFVVTLSDVHNVNYRIRDFCECNDVALHPTRRKGRHNITGDIYYFCTMRNKQDATNLAGLIVSAYIHLDPLPKNDYIRQFLTSRIRRGNLL